MLTFEDTILHILDSEHNTIVISDECMDEQDEIVNNVLLPKATKVFSSMKKKKAVFKEGSYFREWVERYRDKQLTFEDLSKKIAQCVFDAKMKYGLYASSDLIIAIVIHEGRRYLMGIENSYHEGFTHDIRQGDKTCNVICQSSSLLSNSFVKDDRAFLIELSDLSLSCIESKVAIEADQVNFFATIVLQSESEPSYKEAVKSITKTSEMLVDKYELDELEVMPKVKRIINENVSAQTPINIEEVADLLFASKPLAKGDFKEELKTQGVQKDIAVEYVKPTKSDTVQKIKTDRGIEISIPIDYMNSKDFVEFVNHGDGTISIQLKNILHFSSK